MPVLDVPFRLTLDFVWSAEAPTERQLHDDGRNYASAIADPEAWRTQVQALFASIVGDPNRLRRYVEADVRRKLGMDLAEATWDAAAPEDWVGAEQRCREIIVEAARAVGGATEAFVLTAQRDGLWGERLGVLSAAFEARPVSTRVDVTWPEGETHRDVT